MERKILLWIVIAVLVLAVLFMTFKSGGASSSVSTAQAVGSAAQSAASGGMVGGC